MNFNFLLFNKIAAFNANFRFTGDDLPLGELKSCVVLLLRLLFFKDVKIFAKAPGDCGKVRFSLILFNLLL
jgi:hypothetical protein